MTGGVQISPSWRRPGAKRGQSFLGRISVATCSAATGWSWIVASCHQKGQELVFSLFFSAKTSADNWIDSSLEDGKRQRNCCHLKRGGPWLAARALLPGRNIDQQLGRWLQLFKVS